VTPLIADVTTATRGSRALVLAMTETVWAMASALPTDVPPNLSVSIGVVSTEITRIVQMLFKNHKGTKTQRHEEKSKKLCGSGIAMPLWSLRWGM
jgi:hypothetical protein